MGLLRRTGRTTPAPRGTLRITRPSSLTASATSVGVQDAEARARSHQPVATGQNRIERALGFYDSLGEIKYASNFYSRAMERIRFFPAVLNDQNEPEEIEEGPLRDLFDRIRDPGGTTIRQLARSYGQLRFLIGDGHLIAWVDQGEEVWEFLSPLELKRKRDTNPVEYERDTGSEKITYVEAGDLEEIGAVTENGRTVNRARVWRLWRRHPGKSGHSDAPVLGVLDDCELLHRLTLAAGATSGNRMALRDPTYIPNEISLAGQDEDEPGLDEDPEQDTFFATWIEMATTAISNPESIDSVIGPLMRGPAVVEDGMGGRIPMMQCMGKVKITSDTPYFETDAWGKVIDRLENGLDFPSGTLSRVGETNHWGGWLMDEQGFRQHIAGVVEEFCDDLASAYLRPAAITAKVPNADRVVIWYDPVAAVAHPDKIPTAKDAWENGVVSSDYYRATIGAGGDDAPTEEDLAILFALKGRRLLDQQAQGETAPQDGGTGADTTKGAPAAEPTDGEQNGGTNGNGAAASAQVRAAMILGAAEMFALQARKAAGSRLVQWTKNCEPCREAIRDVPPDLVASALGPDRVRDVIDGHRSEAQLVDGQGRLFALQVREWGIGGDWPTELGRRVEAHALRSLYEAKPPPLPAGFAETVARALVA